MQLDDKMISKIAQLARLEIDAADKEKLLMDMNQILGFVEKLQEVNTEGIDPLIYMNGDENIFRADAVKEQLPADNALVNAPGHTGKYFKVPKVIKKSL